ncbi:unnamed protein product [Rhodiola kirilowii]
MRPRIYLFGDSITEESFDVGGWGAALADHFARTADVVLRGYSGYNTRWALKVIDRVFPDDGVSPIAVTVFFGANDACLPNRCSGFQHVPIDEYKKNLQAIVSFFKKRWPATEVILISPPPIDDEVRPLYPYVENLSGLPERTNDAAGTFAHAAVEAAKESGVLVIDLWTIMQKNPDWKTYLWNVGLSVQRYRNIAKEYDAKINEEVNIKLMKNGFCSKLSDYADMSAGEASSEKKPSVDIHERPQKLRRFVVPLVDYFFTFLVVEQKSEVSELYTSEVEADDMNMSTENIEESCAGEEQVNLASACCPQDLSQLDTDQTCTPSAINVPGDYLKMGGGFCIDEEN